MSRDWTRKAFAIGVAMGASAFARSAAASEGTLEIIPDPHLVGLLIVLFLVLVPVLQRLLFAPLLQVLDEREARIEGTQTRAAELSRDAEAELARHEAAVRAARAEAERAHKAALAAAQAQLSESVAAARGESAQRVESARREIGRALEGARSVLQTQTRELAREAAARILGRSLS
jgi:F-type H+-transporting ATPase subunit b